MSAVLALTGVYSDAAGWLRCHAHGARDCACQDGQPVTLASPEPAHDAPGWRRQYDRDVVAMADRAANHRAAAALVPTRCDCCPDRMAGACRLELPAPPGWRWPLEGM